MMDHDPYTPTSDLLRQGIAAVKAGEREKGRVLLMQVLEADETVEQAWIWLSGAVETDEDRRICLENVLALNPGNVAAQKGLAKLGPASQPGGPAGSPRGEIVIRREHAANTPAAAILYPDKQADEWTWRDTSAPLTQAPAVEFTSTPTFDDGWTGDKDLCVYCGHEIAETDKRCQNCRNKLYETKFKIERPSSNLNILWVLMVAVAQFSLFQLLYNIAAKAATIDWVLDGMIIALMLILAAGIYFRQRWAYVTSMVILPVVVFVAASRVITNFPIANVIRNALGNNAVMVNLASAIISPVVDLLIGGVKILQIITALGAAFLAVLGVSADFDRVTTRLVARVEKSFKEASQYYSLGQTYARRGMWAGAILHWQRAVARDPVKITYHRALGEAYARLGFYERSLDVLQTALQSTTKPAAQADLEQLIQVVRQRQEQELAKSAA